MNGTSEESAKSDLANLDLAYLISYAVFMFVSGWAAERLDLRYFLSGAWMSFLYRFPLPMFQRLVGILVLKNSLENKFFLTQP